jgi:hypothetical protein
MTHRTDLRPLCAECSPGREFSRGTRGSRLAIWRLQSLSVEMQCRRSFPSSQRVSNRVVQRPEARFSKSVGQRHGALQRRKKKGLLCSLCKLIVASWRREKYVKITVQF